MAGFGAMVGAINTLVVDTLVTGYFIRRVAGAEASAGYEKQQQQQHARRRRRTTRRHMHLHTHGHAHAVVSFKRETRSTLCAIGSSLR